jgi:hypothetical protein
MLEFKREERYIVIKRKHLDPETERMLRDEMTNLGVSPIDCAVIEPDWPEYEVVWRMIEARFGGRAYGDTLDALGEFYDNVHAMNVAAGWWTDIKTGQPKKRNVGEMFILMVTELAEAFSAYVDKAMDDKLPQFPGLGVEMGDVQIRLADFMGALRAGRIVHHTLGTFNPGEDYFLQVRSMANRYEAIRKTPQAVGEEENGDYIDPMDVVEMIVEKLRFNASRLDHTIAHRLSDEGKRT